MTEAVNSSTLTLEAALADGSVLIATLVLPTQSIALSSPRTVWSLVSRSSKVGSMNLGISLQAGASGSALL